jgi:hypothetical protein
MLMWPSNGWPKDPLSIASEPFNAKFDQASKDFVFKGEKKYMDYSDSSTRGNRSFVNL